MNQSYKTVGKVVDSHQKASQLASERKLSWAPPVASSKQSASAPAKAKAPSAAKAGK